MTNKVVILGSTNVDQFLTVERYAQPGETLHVEEAQKHSAEVKVPTRLLLLHACKQTQHLLLKLALMALLISS